MCDIYIIYRGVFCSYGSEQLSVTGMFFLYSVVSSPYDRSKHFTLHPLVDLFILTATRFLREGLARRGFARDNRLK